MLGGEGTGRRAALEDLIVRSARRDQAAFATLYAQTSAQLFGAALRIVGRREVAEEVLQESWVTVWRQAAAFDPARGSAIGWLSTIVRHCAIDHLRRSASRPEEAGLPDLVLNTFAGAGGSERGAELRALRRCLDELDEAPRRAVLLAYCYGLTRDELAVRLGAPLGTVKSWLRRSLARLKQCLDG